MFQTYTSDVSPDFFDDFKASFEEVMKVGIKSFVDGAKNMTSNGKELFL